MMWGIKHMTCTLICKSLRSLTTNGRVTIYECVNKHTKKKYLIYRIALTSIENTREYGCIWFSFFKGSEPLKSIEQKSQFWVKKFWTTLGESKH